MCVCVGVNSSFLTTLQPERDEEQICEIYSETIQLSRRHEQRSMYLTVNKTRFSITKGQTDHNTKLMSTLEKIKIMLTNAVL